MKRLFAIILIISIIFSLNTAAVAYSAECFVLIDSDDLSILSSSNENMHHSMASTTKIMTALLLCESGNLSKLVKINAKSVAVEGTSVGLKANDVISRECLLYGLMLESGNDAANVIAAELAENGESFAEQMNKKAHEIGMKNTNFVTPSGLDDRKHYSSAYDMAVLTAYAMKNDDFRRTVGTSKYHAVYNSGKTTRTYCNHNRLLWSLEGAEGVKTGFTKKSGRCLVSSCKRNGKRLICVTLNAPNDWNDHKSLFDFGFAQYEQIKPDFKLDIKDLSVIGGKQKTLNLALESVNLTIKKDSASKLQYYVVLPSFIYAPVLCGDVIGRVEYLQNGTLLAKANITATESVEKAEYDEPEYINQIFNLFLLMLKTA